MVIQLPKAFSAIPDIPDHAQRHIRFQRHQASVRIREGNHPVAQKEILIPAVQIVLLKLAHPIPGESLLLIQAPQQKPDALLLVHHRQIECHLISSFRRFFIMLPH